MKSRLVLSFAAALLPSIVHALPAQEGPSHASEPRVPPAAREWRCEVRPGGQHDESLRVTRAGLLFVQATASKAARCRLVDVATGEALATLDLSEAQATCSARVAVTAEQELRLSASATEASAVHVRLLESPCDEACAAATEAALRAHDEAVALAEAQGLTPARQLLLRTIDELRAAPATPWCAGACDALETLADAAYRMDLLSAARDALLVVEHHRQRVLPARHLERLEVRMQRGLMEGLMGETERAADELAEVHDLLAAQLGEEHEGLIHAKLLAAQLEYRCGRAHAALERLQAGYALLRAAEEVDEQLLAAYRVELANTLYEVGDHRGSQLVNEETIASRAGEPPEDLQRIAALSRLANGMRRQGDNDGARAIEEQVLPILLRVDDEDSMLVNAVRENLGVSLLNHHRHEEALVLLQQAEASMARFLSEDDAELLLVRQNLAVCLKEMGRVAQAFELEGRVLAGRARSQPRAHPQRLMGELNYAISLRELSRLDEARAMMEAVLRGQLEDARLPESDEDVLLTRMSLIATAARQQRLWELRALCEPMIEGLRQALWTSALAGSPREVTAVVEHLDPYVGTVSSTMLGLLALPELAADGRRLAELLFPLLEERRGLALLSARLALFAERSEEGAALRARIRVLSGRIAATSRWPARRGELLEALLERERNERALRALLGDGLVAPRFDLAQLQETLDADEVAVGISVLVHWIQAADGSFSQGRNAIAMVLRPDAPLELVDLGPAPELEALVDAWRETLREPAADARGPARAAALHARLIDPLQLRASRRRMYVTSDSLVPLVPMDALPSEGGLLGDALEVVRLPTLVDLLLERPVLASDARLLAVGDIDYGPAAAGGESFAPLRWTRQELELVSARFVVGAQGGESERQRGSDATVAAFLSRAPMATHIHVATHGWFRPVGEGRLAPLANAGLAFRGANGEGGRVTAEELATLDLRRCQLAVLSACETSAGTPRVGLGLASLQNALLASGARQVVTSLWKAHDLATLLLMDEFYRRHWELGEPAAGALWKAKHWLRGASAVELRERLRTSTAQSVDTIEASLRGIGKVRAPAASAQAPFADPFYWAGWVVAGVR